MDEREAIALNIRLPAGMLEGFTRLVEQLRYLAAEVNGGGSTSASVPARPLESGENTAFDFARFQGMEENAEEVGTAGAALSAPDAPMPLRADLPSGEETAEGSVPPTVSEAEEVPAAPPPPAPVAEDTPAVRTEAAGNPTEILPLRSGQMSAPDTPASASFAVSPMPEASGGRWSGVTEELSGGGDAPMTARAVSQAFRRDGRRYDNGFTLY